MTRGSHGVALGLAMLVCLSIGTCNGASTPTPSPSQGTGSKLLPENVVQGGYGPVYVSAKGMNASLNYTVSKGSKPVFECNIDVTGKVKGKHSALFNPWDPYTRVGLYKGKQGKFGQPIEREIKGTWTASGVRGRVKHFDGKLQLTAGNATDILKQPELYYVQITWPPKKMSDWYFTIRGQLA